MSQSTVDRMVSVGVAPIVATLVDGIHAALDGLEPTPLAAKKKELTEALMAFGTHSELAKGIVEDVGVDELMALGLSAEAAKAVDAGRDS